MVQNKLGQFLFVIGWFFLLVFISSYLAATPQVSLLLVSLILIIWGIYLKSKNPQPPPPSMRFKTIRKILRKNDDSQNSE